MNQLYEKFSQSWESLNFVHFFKITFMTIFEENSDTEI